MDDALLDWLFNLGQFGIKFGLHNIEALVAALDHPERSYRSVHVAGTNGKGSVTALVDTALRGAGHRTGRYTSPHLLDLRERFLVDGRAVAQPDMLEALARVRAAVDDLRSRGTLDVHPTFFEVTTALAFEIFRRQQVEIAVCEVGLGGRLDATNVLVPMVTAITSIGFDHEQYLGNTLAAIASEKAGIIKPGAPVVVGGMAADAFAVIAETARSTQAPLVTVSDSHVTDARVNADGTQSFVLRTPRRDYGRVTLALRGEHQIGNALVAVRLLEQMEDGGIPIGRDAIIRALALVRWPGRLEQVSLADGREVLLDAAHNPEGAAALAHYLEADGDPRPMVFSAMRDKNAAAMLDALGPRVSRIILTRASNPRAADPMDLAAIARRAAPRIPVEVVPLPSEALARGWSLSRRILVAGSIFLLADVMKELGLS